MKKGTVMAAALIAIALFLPSLACATGYPYDAPPQPLSISGYVVNSDGSPADKGVIIYAVNEANGEFEETETGSGFPPSKEFYNKFKASLSYDPKEEQKVLVIAVFGGYYARKEVPASGAEGIELALKFDPISAFNAANEVNTIHKEARAELNEPVAPVSQKNVLVQQTLAVAIVALIIFFIFRPKPKKVRMLHALVLMLCIAGTLAAPSYAAGSNESVLEAIISFFSSFLQPTALQVQPDAGIFAPPQPVAVEGFVYNSDMSTVPNCTSVNATTRFPNGTIENLEQTCTGKGFPPVPQYYYKYKASLTGELGVDTVNVTAWNATHYGVNSTIVASNVNLTIILNESFPDTIPPTWSGNTTSLPAAYSPSAEGYFNVTWTDSGTVSTVLLESNITAGVPSNHTMSPLGNDVYGFNDTLPAGTYYWKSYAVDSNGNWNVTDTWYFTILQADNPVTMYLRNTTGEYVNQNITLTYGSQTNITGTSASGAVNLYRDEVQRGTGGPTMKSEITVLPAKPAGWEYKVNATGNQNYSDNSSLTYYVHVNLATPSMAVTFSPGSVVTYPTTTTAFCNITAGDQSATLVLERNGTTVSSGSGNRSDTVLLGGGAYNYTCTYQQSENYTGTASLDNNLVVNPASNTVHLYLNGTLDSNRTITYPAVSNATATASGGTVHLYRDGVEKSNPEIAQLAANPAGYAYIVNATGNGNYTDAPTIAYYLKIDRATSAASLTVNPPAPVTYGTTTTASCSDTNPEASPNLYRNDTLANSENGAGIVLAAGGYSYVCNVTQTENYTSATNSTTYVVSKASPTSYLHIEVNGTENDIEVQYPSATDTIAWSEAAPGKSDLTFNLYRNGVQVASGDPADDVRLLGAGNYTYVYNTSGGQNYTSGSITRLLNVTKAANPVMLYLDGLPNSNSTITYGAGTNATGTIAVGTVYLYRDEAQVATGSPSASEIVLLGANPAGYAYKVNGTGNANYSDNSTGLTHYEIINQANPSPLMHIAVNGSETNQDYGYGNVTNTTGWTGLTGQNGMTFNLYFNGAGAGSGTNVQHIALLGAGNHTYVYNTSGNQNYTPGYQIRLLNITKAPAGAVQNYLHLAFNGTVDSNRTYGYEQFSNATGYKDISQGTLILYRNGAEVGSGQAPSEINRLGNGTYNYTVYFPDNGNYSAGSITYYLLMNKKAITLYLALNGTEGDLTGAYGMTLNATAWKDATVNNEGTQQLLENSSNVGSLTKVFQPAARDYEYKTTFTATNYTAADVTRYASISKVLPSYNIVTNCTWGGTTYGAFCNVTGYMIAGDPITTQSLQRNGTEKATGPVATEIERLGAGAWNYSYVYPGSENYTQSWGEQHLIITKATPTVTETTNSPVTYPAQTSATCSHSTINGEGSTAHTRNGTAVANTYNEVLGAGGYNFTCAFAATQNYTAASDAKDHAVYQGTPTLTLLLNGTDSDYSYEINSPANFTIITGPPGLAVELQTNYSEGINKLWGSGTSPFENITTMAVSGKFNFTGAFNGNQNYTAAQATHYATVQDFTPPKTVIYDINDTGLMRGDAWKLYAQWDEAISSSLTEYNVTNPLQNWTTETISGTWTNHTGGTNNSWSVGVHALKFYAADSFGNWNGTLPHKTFTLSGWAGAAAYLNDTAVMARHPVLISCLVRDANTSEAIQNYPVVIKNSSDYAIWGGSTDANGWFNYTWKPEAEGNDTVTCDISDNATLYYFAAYDGSQNLTVTQYYPESPGNVSIDIYNETTGEIILNWTNSSSDNVAGYIIYMTDNMTEGFNFSDPYYVTNNTTNFWIDPSSMNYDEIYYIIRTNDSISGVTDQNNVTLGKYNLKLYTGWNLISLPLMLYNYTTEDIFYNSEDQDEIWRYFPNDTLDLYDESIYYAGYGWYGDSGWPGATAIDNGPGYWYNSMKPGYATTPFNVTLTGTVPTENTTLNMYSSWNLIGLTSVTPKDMNSLFITPSDEDEMWRYDPYDLSDPYKKETHYAGYGWYGDFRTVEDGRGYWYKSNNASSYNWTYSP